MERDPTKRFSSRVEDYIRYRPTYPAALTPWLASHCGLTPQSAIADIGSGTGILSRLLLDFGCEVFGVEPNAAMRSGAERQLAGEPRFHSVDGRAEATGLPAARVEFVTAAQSFHWFDPAAARTEFRRILKPAGWVVLIWNERLVTEGFLAAYEDLLQRLSTDYGRVDHRNIDTAAIVHFFEHEKWQTAVFPNHQDFDLDGIRGRLLSSSYVPLPDSPQFAPMMQELDTMFARHQKGGQVQVLYETKVYFGQLA
ncbi:MAG TPA: class I SAM-dependent methyltransferase [Bryobacteraceae bacterium]|jgi:SAM-dependent methyltransferase|nr:class I SAM-dependent methyltransferase [Bryobacteraceae bacterium]